MFTFVLQKILALPLNKIYFQELNSIDQLVFYCKFPTKTDFMLIYQTESYADFNYYSEILLAHEIYFGINVAVVEYKNGDKNFYIGIRAVGLKSFNLSFGIDLSVKTLGKTISDEERLITMKIENHDGSLPEWSTAYDYVPAEEVEIVLRNIEIESYSKVEFETKEFLISLPTRSYYDKSGNDGDFRWYRNKSPKQTTSKGKRY